MEVSGVLHKEMRCTADSGQEDENRTLLSPRSGTLLALNRSTSNVEKVLCLLTTRTSTYTQSTV
jgi:hypothetical protein